jgi:large subunit ribosomal protein L30
MATKTRAKSDRAAVSPTAQSTPTSDVVLRVTQLRSSIGCKQNQRETLLALGLRKIRQTRDWPDTPQVRGMVHTVRHLVAVEEVESQ